MIKRTIKISTSLTVIMLVGVFHFSALKMKGLSAGTSKPKDSLRACKHWEIVKEKSSKINDISKSNPSLHTGQYLKEMMRLLLIEEKNVRNSIRDVQKKHKELIVLYPQLTTHHAIVLEDDAGTYKDGVYVNNKKVIVIHYNKDNEIKCIVLDSKSRHVYNPHVWTRKIIRLYYPYVRIIELDTYRRNYRLHGYLEKTSPAIQLKALRLMNKNLRATLYSMDALIAAYYDLREKKSDWQINF